jgi:hypothetical protein
MINVKRREVKIPESVKDIGNNFITLVEARKKRSKLQTWRLT